MIVCVTMNSSERDSGRERLALSRAERERESWEEGYNDGNICAAGSSLEMVLITWRIIAQIHLQAQSVLSDTSCKRCLINAYANETRCAFKYEPSDFKLSANILPVFPAWSFSQYHDLHGVFIHASSGSPLDTLLQRQHLVLHGWARKKQQQDRIRNKVS